MTWKPTPEVKALHDEHMQPVRDYATEFERAMRGCRRMVQERINERHLTLDEQKTMDIALRKAGGK